MSTFFVSVDTVSSLEIASLTVGAFSGDETISVDASSSVLSVFSTFSDLLQELIENIVEMFFSCHFVVFINFDNDI